MSFFLEGSTLYLREVKESDVTDRYYHWLHDNVVNQFLESRYTSWSMDSIRSYVKAMEKDPDTVFLAICLKETEQHIGNIKLGPINRVHRYAVISLVIGEKSWWGKGIATQAISLVSECAFTRLNLHKVCASCYVDNQGSSRAFEKAGFRQEGVLRRHYLYQGRYVDGLIFGLMADEWHPHG
jgi:RimJ/RimL family protein N-acetyltransferase